MRETRIADDGAIEQRTVSMDPGYRQLLTYLNAIILANGGRMVVSRTFIDSQPLRELLIHVKPAEVRGDGTIAEGRIVLALGLTEGEIASGKSGLAGIHLPGASN